MCGLRDHGESDGKRQSTAEEEGTFDAGTR